uniref:Nucleoside diphosphate kinase-like domain-containing protein n=1 Tax=Zosterops lateralis melanops TaxID=1220523 RepID=A0A8D2PUM2_ZOSLA
MKKQNLIFRQLKKIKIWRNLMGPPDPEEAKRTCPESIRAQFAQDILSNAVHGSSNVEHAERSIKFVFGDSRILKCFVYCYLKKEGQGSKKVIKTLSMAYPHTISVSSIHHFICDVD